MSCALSKGLVPRVPEKWNKDNPEDPGSTLREEAREVLGEPADTINPDLPVKGDKPAGKKMV